MENKDPKKIISEHMANMARKGHATTLKRHGKEHFKKMNEIRWKKDKKK